MSSRFISEEENSVGKMIILSFEESEHEILDRIKEFLQHSGQVDIEKIEADSIIQIGELVIDSTQHTVHRGTQEVLLTNIEFRMLHFLALHKGMAMSKEQIYEYVWNGEYIFDDSNITSHIRRLRVKVEDDPAKPKYIQTVRGIGYKMPCVDNVNR